MADAAGGAVGTAAATVVAVVVAAEEGVVVVVVAAAAEEEEVPVAPTALDPVGVPGWRAGAAVWDGGVDATVTGPPYTEPVSRHVSAKYRHARRLVHRLSQRRVRPCPSVCQRRVSTDLPGTRTHWHDVDGGGGSGWAGRCRDSSSDGSGSGGGGSGGGGGGSGGGGGWGSVIARWFATERVSRLLPLKGWRCMTEGA